MIVMVQVEIQPNGVINVVHPEQAEIVRMYLTLDEQQNIRVTLKVKPNYTYSNKLYPRPALDYPQIESIIPGFSVLPNFLEDARVTPKYAKHYNTVLEEMVPNATPIACYADGYNFVGDAFITFAIALAMFEKYPQSTTDRLTRLLNMYKNNRYVNTVSNLNGWSQYVTSADDKNIAGSFRALIGAIYKSNGPECIPKLLQYVNDTFLSKSKIKFAQPTNWYPIAISGLLGFVLGSAVILATVP